jgi:hypothetical protein
MGSREHFGKGRLAFERAHAVFINCPFDTDFAPLFDAIVFSVVCCGFIPRSALESGNVSDSRMDRVVQAIFSSKYSIHDLSRCRGEGSEQLARFNMPLELGIAMACRFKAARKADRHDWLLLVPEGHLYQRFISDLSAWDPKAHDGKITSVVPRVVTWLATRPDAVDTPDPQEVLSALPQFEAARQKLTNQWGMEVPWADLVLAAMKASGRIGPGRI